MEGEGMRLLIIPIGRIYRCLRRGAARVLGEAEVESLESDVLTPVNVFVDEVYDDTVGDVAKKIRKRSDERRGI